MSQLPISSAMSVRMIYGDLPQNKTLILFYFERLPTHM